MGFSRLFTPSARKKRWLGPAHPHLYTLTLRQVSNPFDADALWHERFAGQKDILNCEGGQEHAWKRLQTCLDDHPAYQQLREQTDKIRLATAIYTDVVVWIPESMWLQDLTTGAQHIRMLCHNLANNHLEDFRKKLYRGRAPHYVVMPCSQIKQDEVRFQFGQSVFVPGEDDELVAKFKLELTRKRQTESAKRRWSWTFVGEGARKTEREIGIYCHQPSLLLSIDALTQAGANSTYWLKEGGDYLLINQHQGADWHCFYQHEGKTYEFKRQARERVLIFTPPPHCDFDHHSVQVHGVQIDVLRPHAHVADPLQADGPTAERPAVEKPAAPDGGAATLRQQTPVKAVRPRAGFAQFGVTLLADQVLSEQGVSYSLVAEGVALPRIDGPYRIQGVNGWRLWLNEDGDPINDPGVDPEILQTCGLLRASKTQQALLLRLPGHDGLEPVKKLPVTLPNQNGVTELIASPFNEWYAFLQFAHPFAYNLERHRYVIGRYNPESEQQADICLDQISHPKSLLLAEGMDNPHVTFTNLGLSRLHAWVELDGDDLRAGAENGLLTCCISKDMSVTRCLRRGSQDYFTLQDGDRLVVGNYILRFDRD